MIKRTTATFTLEGRPDVVAAAVTGPLVTGLTIDFNNGGPAQSVAVADSDCSIQLAEALQFGADTISAEIPGRMSPFVRGWTNISADVHENARAKGFWENGVERNDGEMLCLIHSEISEALEALRNGNPPDNKLPEFTNVEVELADAVIRIMDLAHARGWQVAKAIEAKAQFNRGRPHKHGKEF